jgi:chromosome condensin MukBEF ATPase and DNA-binding subunit MukB
VHNSARRGIDAHHDAEEAARRANAAAATTEARYNPVTVANRIERIAADIRRLTRRIEDDVYDGEKGYQPATEEQKAKRAEHYAPQLDELRDQLAYWEQVRAAQIASGKATGYSPATIRKGDAVKIGGHWRRVVRVNTKTVSIETGYSWTDRATYVEIPDHRTGEVKPPGGRG